MAKLLIMQGLPASGKTTRARELMVQYGNAVRINRDELRTMLHTGEWTDKKEGVTRDVARSIAAQLLRQNIGMVLIDDTNLAEGTVESWKTLARDHAASFEIMRLETSMAECLRRDRERDEPVGRHVIIGMAMQYGLYPRPAKGFVLCDLDGTLADIAHRTHFVQQDPKDWQGFFGAMGEDTVREDVFQQIAALRGEGYEILFISGRPDTYREKSEAWLVRSYRWHEQPILFMRRAGDHRPDDLVKQQMLHTYFPDKSWIKTVIDDRPSVLRMWKAEGLEVIDVGMGEEF